MKTKELRIGIAGLGGAGLKLLLRLRDAEGVELAGATDNRAEARDAFEATYCRPAYATIAAMCRSRAIDAVYIATPSPLHCEHTLQAVRAGKHVMCEKPLATNLADCDRMIQEAQRAGVVLLQGHSKVLEAPISTLHGVITSGRIGEVFHIDALNYNDWMRRPRLVPEIDTDKGGGVVFRQAPQQIDMVRYLIGIATREPCAL